MVAAISARKKPRRIAKAKPKRRGAVKISAKKRKQKRIVVPAYGRQVRSQLRQRQHQLRVMSRNKWVNSQVGITRGLVLSTLYESAAKFKTEADFKKAIEVFARHSRSARRSYDVTKARTYASPQRKLTRIEELRDEGVQAALAVVYARDLFKEITEHLQRPAGRTPAHIDAGAVADAPAL